MIITVSRVETLNNSVWGNPRFRLHTESGVFTTMSDASFCHGLMNGWNSFHDQNGRSAEVVLTRAGRVRHLRWVPAVSCEDMHKARGRLEKARDARGGHLGDTPEAKAFDWALELFNQMSRVHHRETDCTDFH